MLESDINNGLATALEGVHAPAESCLDSNLEIDEAALIQAARLFIKKSHATTIRIEHKLAWGHDRARKAVNILVERGVLSPADGGGVRFNVLSANLRKFLGEDEIVEQVPEPAAEPAARSATGSETEPHPSPNGKVTEVTVDKVRFSAPLAGIRNEKPKRTSRKDELFSLLDGIDKVEIPGLISGEERLKKINQAAREIQNMVDATNSGIRRMELAGKRVSRHNHIRFVKYDPAEGALGGIELFIKNRKDRHNVIWQVCWEPQFSQQWLDRKIEGAAAACQRHLKNLGGYALIKGR